MSIEVIPSHYGPPATKVLGERIDALKNGNPLAPVTVVVPTNLAGLAVRRALGARGHGIAAVDFLKMGDLAARLARRQMGDDRKKVSDLIIGAALRRALSDDPGVFSGSAHHWATEQALIRVYRELREASEESLDLLAEQSARAKDVVRLCLQVRSDLQPKWYDDQDLSQKAIEGLRWGSLDAIVAELGPVIVYLPQRVSRSHSQMISALAEATTVKAIVGLTGNARADAPVLESMGHMGGSGDTAISADTPGNRRIISASNVDEEARIAVREVVHAAIDGITLGRLAVLCGGGPSAIRQVQNQLSAAGITFTGPRGLTLAETLLGRGILALLNLKARGFRRDEVFALLSVAALPVATIEATSQTTFDLVMAWERVSRHAGVARGAEQWIERLNRYASEEREKAQREEEDPDGVEGRACRHGRNAEHAESLCEFMSKLIRDLSHDPEPATWRQWCGWIEDLINKYLGDEEDREGWLDHEQQAAKDIFKILGRLAALDDVEGNPRSATFLPTLTTELGAPSGRVGRLGHGVLTDSIGASLGLELDRLILVGLSEGTFPHSPSEDALLPDVERKAAGDDNELLPDRLADQHRGLLAALESAKTAVMVYARGDSRASAEQYPSRWLVDEATKLAGRRVEATSLETYADQEWFEHVPSFWGRVEGADFSATSQEFRIRALAGEGPAAQEVREDDQVLSRGAEMVAARASDKFTRFDGNLAGVPLPEVTQSEMSPTRLETWADCPMRYLFQHILRVQPVEQPEEQLEISALEKGSLVHHILDRFLAEQLKNGQVPQPDQPWSEQQRVRLQEIGQDECDEVESKGLTGAPVYWNYDRGRILVNLDRFIEEDNELRREHGTRPMASELAFGVPGDDGKIVQDAVEVDLPNGRTVRFRGRVDRVDRGADGKLLVTDYKTGKTDRFKGLNEGSKDWDPVQRGTRLQLPVYGLAARDSVNSDDAPVQTQYWFVTDEGDFRICGYPLDDNVLDCFRQTVATITKGIESGVFCDRPKPDQTSGPYSQRCDFCNGDRLGTEDGRQKWNRMASEGELSDYRNLAEPTHDGNDHEAEEE